MTDREYDVLDELYFIKSWDELLDSAGLRPSDLRLILVDLIQRGWVKAVSVFDGEMPPDDLEAIRLPEQFHYLATKAGLLAHTGRG